MARSKLILIASKRMDSNKKEGRNENTLIRMPAATRDNMGVHGKVELWPADASGEDRLNKSVMLTIFHAFSADLTDLKKNKKLSEAKKNCVGFVTTKMFNYICGGKKSQAENVWISNDIYDTVIGTDPEFLFFEKGKDRIISAANVLPKHGEIGSDGAMAEIRPKPEVSVDQLIENMRAIFQANKNHPDIKNLRWVATCWYKDTNRGYPVGGHIHVGNPQQLMTKSGALRMKFYKVLNKILDEFLALPLIKLDGPDGKYRRMKGTAPMGPFGYYGGLRTDIGRLEHRTLSGIWLMHPDLSLAVLGTAKAIIDETFRRIENKNFKPGYVLPETFARSHIWSASFNKWDEIPLAVDMGCTTPSQEMIEILNEKDHRYWTLDRIKKFHNKLKRMSTYNENRRYIDGFCEILKVKYSEFKQLDREIQKNWLTKKKFVVSV